ncbi:MAG: CotH kinase family protein [Bacteroidia bacterium]|nr:CotH kinase family protein [Bacteroidia bacterium]
MKSRFLFLVLLLFAAGTGIRAQQYNNDGDTLFGSDFIHEIRFNFYHPAFYDSLTASYVNDTYYVCNMVFDGVAFDSIGLKFKGNSSYNNPSVKKSMKVDLDYIISAQDLDDINKFNLGNGFKDPTYMREKIMSDLCVKNGIPAPRVTYAKVYYNNTLWGFFTLTEEVNKDFVDGWFDDKKGNLFKGDPSGDLKWINNSPSSYYSKYELKTNETQNDWTDLVQLIDKINNTTLTDLRDSLDNHFNTALFFRSWAACNVFANLDSYIGSGHNYFIYHDSLDYRWQFILYDMNEAFGVFAQMMTISQLENLSPLYLSSPSNRPVCNRLLQDPASLQQLMYEICDFIQPDKFSNSNLDPKIDSLANRIRTDVYADPNKLYSNQNFEDNQIMNLNIVGPGGGNFPGLKSFITNRRNSLITSLAAYGCFLGMQDEDVEQKFLLAPNPSAGQLTIRSAEELIQSVEISSISGQTVYRLTDIQQREASLDLAALPAGVYYLRINTQWVQKLVITR